MKPKKNRTRLRCGFVFVLVFYRYNRTPGPKIMSTKLLRTKKFTNNKLNNTTYRLTNCWLSRRLSLAVNAQEFERCMEQSSPFPSASIEFLASNFMMALVWAHFPPLSTAKTRRFLRRLPFSILKRNQTRFASLLVRNLIDLDFAFTVAYFSLSAGRASKINFRSGAKNLKNLTKRNQNRGEPHPSEASHSAIFCEAASQTRETKGRRTVPIP